MIVPVIIPLNRTAAMASYTVHEPPTPAIDRLDRADSFVFVRDGFSWGPALLGPLWLALKRLWMPLAAWAAVAVAMAGLLYAAGAGPQWITLALAALNVLIGFEGNECERQTLEARGWTELATVSGKGLAEAERSFFERWMPSHPLLAGNGGGSHVTGPADTFPRQQPTGKPRALLQRLLGPFASRA